MNNINKINIDYQTSFKKIQAFGCSKCPKVEYGCLYPNKLCKSCYCIKLCEKNNFI